MTRKLSVSAVACLMMTILASTTLVLVTAFPTRRDSIPNGYKVPDPCRPGRIWNWDSTLCNADSDMDGLTNGQELGDPSCTWTPGVSPRTTGLSHPGINNDQPGCAIPLWLWYLLFWWTR